MITDDTFLKIVRSAVKAPSSHNSQPWLFSREKDAICIVPDFSRTLTVADPQNRELFISLGCAAENTMIAARFYGYNSEMHIESVEESTKIRLRLRKEEDQVQPDLFSYINYRQTTRNMYDNFIIPQEYKMELKNTITLPNIDVIFYTGEDEIKKLYPYILESNNIQISDLSYIHELIQWMRFSQNEAVRKGDGLYVACFGFPLMGRTIGSFVVGKFMSVKREERRLLKQLNKTSTMALITSMQDDPTNWIHTGICFQRLALTATKLNLNHSYLNAPCQVPCVRLQMMSQMPFPGAFPQLLILLGHSEKMPFAFRRRINDVLI